MLVIGLIGSKGAGKDTVADIAIDKFNKNNNVKKLSFARPFKDWIMKDILKFTHYQVDDPKGKEAKLEEDVVLDHRKLRKIVRLVCEKYNDYVYKNRLPLNARLNPFSIAISNWENKTFKAGVNTNRDVMKFISTEIIRSIHPTWHAEMTLSLVDKDSDNVYLIADMRFNNEYNLSRQAFRNDFKLAYVKNDEAEAKNTDTHASEQEFKNLTKVADAVIISEYGKLEELAKEAQKAFTAFKSETSENPKKGKRGRPKKNK